MKFDKIYKCEEETSFDNYASVDSRNKTVTYFIDVKDFYKIENNSFVVDDAKLIKIKDKALRKEIGKHGHLKDAELEGFFEHYLLSINDCYIVATNAEDVNPEDILLEPNEFVIKKIIE